MNRSSRIKKSKTSLVETLKKTKLEEELSQKNSRNLSYSSPSFKKMLISQRFYFGVLVQLVKYLILGAKCERKRRAIKYLKKELQKCYYKKFLPIISYFI